jgi:predicted nucleic acid-binding protein
MDDLDRNKEYLTTVVSQFELLTGAYQVGRREIEASKILLSRFKILNLDRHSADEAARLYADLRRKGKEIPARDAMIAGIAKVYGCALITKDTAHFRRVPGLKVVSW